MRNLRTSAYIKGFYPAKENQQGSICKSTVLSTLMRTLLPNKSILIRMITCRNACKWSKYDSVKSHVPYSLKFSRFKNFAVFAGCTLTTKIFFPRKIQYLPMYACAIIVTVVSTVLIIGLVWLYVARARAQKFYPRKFVSGQNLTKPRNILNFRLYSF